MTSYDALIDDLLSHSYADTREAKTATALDLVLEGDVDGLRLFLQQQQQPRKDAMLGFQVNARSPTTGRSLLHEACAEGQMEIVKLLLERTDADLMLRTMLVLCIPRDLCGLLLDCLLFANDRDEWVRVGSKQSVAPRCDQQPPRCRIPVAEPWRRRALSRSVRFLADALRQVAQCGKAACSVWRSNTGLQFGESSSPHFSIDVCV